MAVGFITSYLVICLMLIMTPLLLPLALLKVTASYFDQYWRIILSGFLTPVIITAYSMFALILYDKVLFDEKAPIQKLFKYENIKEALQPGRAATIFAANVTVEDSIVYVMHGTILPSSLPPSASGNSEHFVLLMVFNSSDAGVPGGFDPLGGGVCA